MPDSRLGQGSDFARHQRRLGSWLRDNVRNVRSLAGTEIHKYARKNVVAGWEINLPDSNRRFHVLLNDSFPYSRVQVAYVGSDQYMQWPHTEEENYLCLPDSGWRPCEHLEDSIAERLGQASELVTKCQSERFVKSESQREFLTYWSRQKDILSSFSIIDIKNTKPRKVAARRYKGGYIIGETDDHLASWLDNSGVGGDMPPIQAIFAFIDKSPSLPLPQTGRQFDRLLLNQVPNLNGLIGGLSPFETTLVILASRSDHGVALLGAKFHAASKNGFRSNPVPKAVRRIWSSFSHYSPVRVTRADSGWIHGRDQGTEGHQTLSTSHVVVLGAGSLGSQVASRLAQAGVGRISIIDPEALDPSNMGRHALGMESLNTNKALSLTQLLSVRYPHGRFEGFEDQWQGVLRDTPHIFEEADIVVSCMGEVEQDFPWDASHQSGALGQTPTVYGWLGTQGTTGHALALVPGGPTLSCFFDADGFLKYPDTHFPGGDQLRAEPACGTEFQPYGPLAAGQIELLVTRATIDTLTTKISAPFHRVYACSSKDLNELGGRWTDHHKAHRPDGYEGPFEYTPAVNHCQDCRNCR